MPPPRGNADALAPADLDDEVRAHAGSNVVLPLSRLLDGRWHAVPGTGVPADALAQLGPFAMLVQAPAQSVQKLDWLDMAVPVGSTGHNAGLRSGDRFVAARGGGAEWGPRVWARKESQNFSAGSVHYGVNWPDVNGPPGQEVVPIPPAFAASLRAGATIFIVRDGRALRLVLPAGGDALGVSWTKPPKSAFYR